MAISSGAHFAVSSLNTSVSPEMASPVFNCSSQLSPVRPVIRPWRGENFSRLGRTKINESISASSIGPCIPCLLLQHLRIRLVLLDPSSIALSVWTSEQYQDRSLALAWDPLTCLPVNHEWKTGSLQTKTEHSRDAWQTSVPCALTFLADTGDDCVIDNFAHQPGHAPSVFSVASRVTTQCMWLYFSV